MRSLLIIGAGGFIGSVARYLAASSLSRQFSSSFPYGTLAVNISGCFLIGLIYAISERGNILTPEWRIFLATGLCGGYTTFSTFTYEGIRLMQGGEFLSFSLYVIASVALCLAATWFGVIVIKL